MKFKFLKVIFMSIVLSASGLASAGVIALDDWFDTANSESNVKNIT